MIPLSFEEGSDEAIQRRKTCMHWIASLRLQWRVELITTSPVRAFRNDDGQKIAASSAAMTGGVVRQWVARIRVLTKFCKAKLAALCQQWRAMFQNAWNVNRKMNKCPKALAVVFEAAPEIEHRRRRRPRERRLKAGKMLRWSILSESPSSCAAKACAAWDCDRKGSAKPR